MTARNVPRKNRVTFTCPTCRGRSDGYSVTMPTHVRAHFANGDTFKSVEADARGVEVHDRCVHFGIESYKSDVIVLDFFCGKCGAWRLVVNVDKDQVAVTQKTGATR